ncbi:MAG: 2-hydroxychromene-2-carboxylate isomerase [Burkholderiales bacterium]|jgi:2-hydroxychromene-2-carboxylate isomerase|nr:2-hydroxychromene-2-carboxylate isomerase [Burkholderiales bacterium]
MKSIEVWFEFGSNYSYPAVMRLPAAAQKAAVCIRWKPFLLGPIFRSFGWTTSPFVTQKEKGAYVWRDMQRLCARYGIPWTRPTAFPRRAILPMRVALLCADAPWIAGFCQRMMLQNFARDREIDTPQAVGAALSELGLDAESIIAQAQSDGTRAALRAQTDEACRLGIFGAPTFLVDGEMFWGNDRLEDALAWDGRAA